MRANSSYKDLEDTIQYILAKKEGCELIISNDRDFFSEDILLMSSKEFLESVKPAQE
jgi:predicted nucleic acid-binding protein